MSVRMQRGADTRSTYLSKYNTHSLRRFLRNTRHNTNNHMRNTIMSKFLLTHTSCQCFPLRTKTRSVGELPITSKSTHDLRHRRGSSSMLTFLRLATMKPENTSGLLDRNRAVQQLNRMPHLCPGYATLTNIGITRQRYIATQIQSSSSVTSLSTPRLSHPCFKSILTLQTRRVYKTIYR